MLVLWRSAVHDHTGISHSKCPQELEIFQAFVYFLLTSSDFASNFPPNQTPVFNTGVRVHHTCLTNRTSSFQYASCPYLFILIYPPPVAQPVARKSRGELMKMVDVAYYGNCDEDDGVIVPQETKYEQECKNYHVALSAEIADLTVFLLRDAGLLVNCFEYANGSLFSTSFSCRIVIWHSASTGILQWAGYDPLTSTSIERDL